MALRSRAPGQPDALRVGAGPHRVQARAVTLRCRAASTINRKGYQAMSNSNPYGLLSLWTQGDLVIRSVTLALVVMSMLSWYVIVVKALQQTRMRKLSAAAGDSFWHTKSFEDGLKVLGPAGSSPFRTLAEQGAEAAAHHEQNKEDLHGALNVSDWIVSCLRR